MAKRKTNPAVHIAVNARMYFNGWIDVENARAEVFAKLLAMPGKCGHLAVDSNGDVFIYENKPLLESYESGDYKWNGYGVEFIGELELSQRADWSKHSFPISVADFERLK